MNSGDFVDPVLLSAWQMGRPVPAHAIGAMDPPGLAQLRLLLNNRLVTKTLLASIHCKRDGERLRLVGDSQALVCPRCSSTIELQNTDSVEYYNFQVNLDILAMRVREAFTERGLQVAPGGSFPASMEVVPIGSFIGLDGSEIDLLLAKRTLSPGALLQVWGHCASTLRTVVLVHPELSPSADSFLRLSFQSSPIYAIRADSLREAKTYESASKFPAFRRTIADRLKGVEGLLFAGDGAALREERIDPFGVDADELSLHGGPSYEPAALKLLSVLAPTLKFSRRGGVRQVPDGILVLPDGVWLVDAKSSTEAFRYRQDERDKIRRYLETIESRSDHFNDKWKFYGLLIVTRTGQLRERDVENARSDLRARPASSIVTIVSHEGLLDIWQRARGSSDYWYRRLLGEDPRDVLLLKKRFTSDARVEESTKVNAESPLRVVTAPVLDVFWDNVLKNRYSGLSGHQPVDVLTDMEEIFIRDFGS